MPVMMLMEEYEAIRRSAMALGCLVSLEPVRTRLRPRLVDLED